MTQDSPADQELRAIAKHFNARVRTSNLTWPNVDGGPFTLVCRLAAWSLPVRLSSNRECLLAEIERPTTFCFAGPIPDPVLGTDRQLGTFADMDVFTPSHFSQTEQLADWLNAHTSALRALVTADREGFVVAFNISVFVLNPAGAEEDRDRLESLISLVEQLPDDDSRDHPVSPVRLPNALRDVVPLIELWAVSDDERRSDMIEGASDPALDELWASVGPRLDQINAFLDGNDSDEAILVGDLAQAALEANAELRRRHTTPD